MLSIRYRVEIHNPVNNLGIARWQSGICAGETCHGLPPIALRIHLGTVWQPSPTKDGFALKDKKPG